MSATTLPPCGPAHSIPVLVGQAITTARSPARGVHELEAPPVFVHLPPVPALVPIPDALAGPPEILVTTPADTPPWVGTVGNETGVVGGVAGGVVVGGVTGGVTAGGGVAIGGVAVGGVGA